MRVGFGRVNSKLVSKYIGEIIFNSGKFYEGNNRYCSGKGGLVYSSCY